MLFLLEMWSTTSIHAANQTGSQALTVMRCLTLFLLIAASLLPAYDVPAHARFAAALAFLDARGDANLSVWVATGNNTDRRGTFGPVAATHWLVAKQGGPVDVGAVDRESCKRGIGCQSGKREEE